MTRVHANAAFTIDPMHLQCLALIFTHEVGMHTIEADSQQLLKQSGTETFAICRATEEQVLRSITRWGRGGKGNFLTTTVHMNMDTYVYIESYTVHTQVAGIYMDTRLIVNVSQVYTPLYLVDTLNLRKVSGVQGEEGRSPERV